jgi:long-chain acyl-CoA synthetase
MIFNIDKHHSEKIAFIDDDHNSISYGKLHDFILEVKSLLIPRSVVLFVSENNVSSISFFIACLESNIVPLVVGAEIDNQLVQYLYDTYKPHYVFKPIHKQIFQSEEEVTTYDKAVLLRTQNGTYEIHKDLALLLPTSGSTGSPKLVRHTLENIEASARNVSKALNINDSHKPILILPFHYTMGMSVVTSHVYAGTTVYLTNKSLTDRALWSVIDSGQINSITGVPFSFEILEKLRFFRGSRPFLKFIYQGGGKLKTDLFDTLVNYAETEGKIFIATYGQTEATARMSYLPSDKAKDKNCSIGIPIPEGVFLIKGEDGNISEFGPSKGELLYKGPNVTMGYARSIEDLVLGDENEGILNTGDIAERDEDGFYYIIGRKSRFLKLYGLRVGLDDLEHLIKSTFPIDCYCTGSDEKMVVNITEVSYESDVKNLIVNKIGLFHQAFEIKVVSEIARSQSGKVIYSK